MTYLRKSSKAFTWSENVYKATFDMVCLMYFKKLRVCPSLCGVCICLGRRLTRITTVTIEGQCWELRGSEGSVDPLGVPQPWDLLSLFCPFLHPAPVSSTRGPSGPLLIIKDLSLCLSLACCGPPALADHVQAREHLSSARPPCLLFHGALPDYSYCATCMTGLTVLFHWLQNKTRSEMGMSDGWMERWMDGEMDG